MKRKHRNQSGFTLIELMFILAFLAIIFMYSVSMARDTARQEAVNNTAIGIKNWLQATLAYYSDYGKWPGTFNNNSADSNDPGVVGNYLPTALVCTQFAGNTSGGACSTGNTSYTGEANGKYYTVSVYVSDEATAKSIAAKLPSAEVVNNKVSSSVPIPGATQGYITSAGLVTVGATSGNSRTIWLPPCEDGFQAHYLVTPQYYTTGFSQGKDDTNKSFNVISDVTKLNLSGTSNTNSRFYVFGNTNFADTPSALFGWISGSQHYYGYYITYCVPGDSSSAVDNKNRKYWMNNNSFDTGSTDPQTY